MVRYRTLLVGLLAPFAAAFLGSRTYVLLTRASTDRDRDFVLRLSLTAAAMALPFVATALLALADRRRGLFGKASTAGLVVATLSLGLLWLPLRGIAARSRQVRAAALDGVPAPAFETPDLDGRVHRLSDGKGQVVLINVWGTWCGPCREEMPKLEQLHRSRRDRGLLVLGLDEEDVSLQREFAQKLGVSYPLLTYAGTVPAVFRDITRYPANFLIDRGGLLRPAPSTDQPFERLAEAVDVLLARPAP
jgi:cytochrome c biogenesis protein CcmG, thiol:disulfide interchange protein DsbE